MNYYHRLAKFLRTFYEKNVPFNLAKLAKHKDLVNVVYLSIKRLIFICEYLSKITKTEVIMKGEMEILHSVKQILLVIHKKNLFLSPLYLLNFFFLFLGCVIIIDSINKNAF